MSIYIFFFEYIYTCCNGEKARWKLNKNAMCCLE